jgi:sulfate adenylyltransferase subunit 1 (EFTu-like GTPase family)
VRALPSGRTTRVSSIVTYDGEIAHARAPQSVTVTLEDEIDLSRGEMLVDADAEPPLQSNAFSARLVWMNEQPLLVGESYLLKHTTRVVRATVRSIRHRVDVVTAEHHPTATLQMNDIAHVQFETNLPLFFDNYTDNRSTGSFILIDPLNNATVAAGMIAAPVESAPATGPAEANPAFIWLRGDLKLLAQVRQRLLEAREPAVNVDDPLIPALTLPAVARALQLAGVTAVSAREDLHPVITDAIKAIACDGWIEHEQRLEDWLKERQ